MEQLVLKGMLAAAVLIALMKSTLAAEDAGRPTTSTQSAACTGAPSAQRTGKPLVGGDRLLPIVISAVKAAEGAMAPIERTWCLEATLRSGDRNLSLSHDAFDPSLERLTAGTDSYEVRAFQDRSVAAALPQPPDGAVYDLILVEGNTVRLVAFFDGPPSIDAMMAFFRNDRFGIYADMDLKTHKITVYRPF